MFWSFSISVIYYWSRFNGDISITSAKSLFDEYSNFDSIFDFNKFTLLDFYSTGLFYLSDDFYNYDWINFYDRVSDSEKLEFDVF